MMETNERHHPKILTIEKRKIVSYVVNECVKSALEKGGIYKSKICLRSLLMFNVSLFQRKFLGINLFDKFKKIMVIYMSYIV